MIERFHKVRFIFRRDEPQHIVHAYHSIGIVAGANELYAENGGGDFSFYLGNSYLGLDFDIESKRVGSFGGAVNLRAVRAAQIVSPKNTADGVLCVRDEGEFVRGGSWRIAFPEQYVFDAERALFQIGAYSADEPCCKFLKNAYCQLDPAGNLKCLLFSDIVFS